MDTDRLADKWRNLGDRFRRIANNNCSEAEVKATAAVCGQVLPRMRDAGLIPANLVPEPSATELQEHAGQPDIIAHLWSTCWIGFVSAISHPRINPGFPIPNALAVKSERRCGPQQVTVSSTDTKHWRIRAENFAAVCDELADGCGSASGDVVDDPPAAATAIELLLGDEAAAILEIARSDKSADDRMRAICGIDNRLVGWKSNRWAELLSIHKPITADAIRGTRFWKDDRKRAAEALRELRGANAVVTQNLRRGK